MKHDNHYQKEGQLEPIDIIEETILRLNRVDSLGPVLPYHVGQTLKYLLRAGSKEQEPAIKDLQKALNYLHRAVKGKWL